MKSLRLGVLFSGGGRSLENLALRILDGTLPAEIAVSVASRPDAGGIERARRLGVPCEVIDSRERRDTFSEDMSRTLEQAGVDLVCLAGFLKLYRFPGLYENRIMNIHPALLPAFGGKGYYGDRVHAAVLESGARFSGCTVHYVTAEYDEGPIILQRVVPVLPKDTVHELADRVFAEECIAYPEAIRLHAEGRLTVTGRRVLVRPD